MLNFTLRPDTSRTAIPAPFLPAPAGPSWADVRAHADARTDLSQSTRERYVAAIDRLLEILNDPLETIEADRDAFARRFPIDGFDPKLWATNDAYGTWRRRAQASLHDFLGLHDERERLRAMEDEWTRLFLAVEPLTRGKVGETAAWHPMKLRCLRTFALVARGRGLQPRDVAPVVARAIDADFEGNKQRANRDACRNLDELRAFPEILPLLPFRPIGPVAEIAASPDGLSSSWEDQIRAWVDRATTSGWDPVTKTHADDHQGHAHVMFSALRTGLRTARKAGIVDDAPTAPAALLAEEDAVCELAGAVLALCEAPRGEGRIAPRTARKYLRLVAQVREMLGHDNAMLDEIIKNNPTARQGKRDDQSMTPENRRFCEALVDRVPIRRRFLMSHAPLRAEAEAILATAGGELDALTGHELARVRMLGVAAAFAAIEVGGAPIRVGNAMGLTCTGEDAQIRIPARGRKPIRVLIPAALVKKSRRPIEFGVRHTRHGFHDTIAWYHRTIRPLFPHAASSPYLFPAVCTPGAALDEGYFGAQFATLMRTIVDLPMRPHQMRHGQTSLLLDRHPNEIEVVAKRIGDTPETLRRHYGWIDALKLVERGQDLLAGLIDG